MIINDDIENAVKALYDNIEKLKSKYPTHKILLQLLKFNQSVISDWYEYKMDNSEVNSQYNEEVMNEILYWINELNKILKM